VAGSSSAIASLPSPFAPQNYPSFEHHENWSKNKWKPACFVFGFASIGLIVPAFGISFAQYARAPRAIAPWHGMTTMPRRRAF
jgi:hypothetical protein